MSAYLNLLLGFADDATAAVNLLPIFGRFVFVVTELGL